MLLVMGGAFAITCKDLFSNYQEPEIKESTIDTVFFLSKTCLALLLIGHAGFGFAVEKQMLINHWQSIGVDADVGFITNVGYGEFALGVLIFLAPVKPLFLSHCCGNYLPNSFMFPPIQSRVWESSIFLNGSNAGEITVSPSSCFTSLATSKREALLNNYESCPFQLRLFLLKS